MNTREIFDLGQLAEAAYGDFYNEDENLIFKDDDDVQNILQGKAPDGSAGDKAVQMSATQARLFIEHWSVVAHQPNTSSGFSATLFRSKTSGELVYATRGTEGAKVFSADILDGFADLGADVFDIGLDGLAIHQIVDMYNDWQRIKAPAGSEYNVKVLEVNLALTMMARLPTSGFVEGLLSSGGLIYDRPAGIIYSVKNSTSNIEFSDERAYGAGVDTATIVTATGHSLGGHLAHSFSRLFGVEAVGINGAGFTEGTYQNANIDNLFSMLGGYGGFSGVRNIYADHGVEFTSTPDGPVLHQQGASDPLYIEDALGHTAGHGAGQMTDSLAVADLFIRLSPELQGLDIGTALTKTNALFEAASVSRLDTLENTARYLGQLFNVSAAVLNPAPNVREGLYQLIDAIHNSDPYKTLQTNGGDFELLPTNADQLKNMAADSEAVRYSLLTLTPFIVTGAGAEPVYAQFSDQLGLYDATLKEGGMSDNYLRDRAKMLALMIQRNNTNKSLSGSDAQEFHDHESGLIFHVSNTASSDITQRYVFGDNTSNTLTGGDKDDFLYGGDEADGLGDTLNGGAGNDYMEGGAGDDTYIAGNGDTILDSDGFGRVLLDGAVMSGGTREAGQTDWTADDGAVYSLNNGVLTVTRNGSSITINDFESGDLGIALTDVDQPPQGDAYDGLLWYATEDAEGNLVFDPRIQRHSAWVNNGLMDSNQYAIVQNGVLHPAEFVYVGFTRNESNVIVDGHQPGAIDTLATETAKGVHNDFIQLSAGNDAVKTHGGMDFIYGGLGDDTLEGGDDSDELQGQAGHDRLFATSEDDLATLFDPDAIATDSSKDYLHGGEGNDQLYGSAGVNLLDGGAGNDLIAAGAGDDFIIGDGLYGLVPHIGSYTGDQVSLFGEIHDIARSGPFSYQGPTAYYDYASQFDWGFTISGDAATGYSVDLSDEIADLGSLYGMPDGLPSEQHGDDVIYAGAGADFVDAGAGDDFVDGGRDNDLIWGRDGNDLLNGGLGDDYLVGDGADAVEPGNDVLLGDAGDDILIGGLGDDSLDGGDGDDQLRGDSADNGSQHGNDILSGGQGTDDIRGQGGNDKLYGGEGNDIIAGDDDVATLAPDQHGDDRLEGGAGMDTLFGGGGNDSLYGGSENDSIFGDADDVDGQYHGIDQLYGEAGDDVLVGHGGSDFLSGGEGMDTLHGDSVDLDGAFHGDDTLFGGDGADRVFGFGGDDALFGGDGDDILAGDDAGLLSDWHGNDVLFGEAGDDRLDGQGGNDQLSGGIGSDILSGGDGDDVLSGGEGADSLYGESGADQLFGDAGNDNLSGGDGNDLLMGGVGADNLWGGAGNDVLSGGVDDDFLDGMAHDDELDGGSGNDRLLGGDGNDRLVGGDGTDRLFGHAGDDVLSGGVGTGDYLEGGAGNDSYLFALGDGDTTINNLSFDGGFDVLRFESGILPDEVSVFRSFNHLGIRIETSGELISVTNFFDGSALDAISFSDNTTWSENDIRSQVITPTVGDDNFIGYAGPDVMFGGAGNDTLHGNEGDDTLDGEGGQDTIYGGTGNDLIRGGSGNDSLFGGADQDSLAGGPGDDRLHGEAGDDQLFGDDGDDILDGGIGADLLNGGADQDTLHGRDGNDVLLGDNGVDFLYGGDGDDTLHGGDLRDTLRGEAGNDALYGDEGDDYLYGEVGSDTLFGGPGQDLLSGGAGDDRLYGGGGDGDILNGGDGSDVYYFAPGDGNTSIGNLDTDGGFDVLEFLPGINAQDILVKRNAAGDLTLKIQSEAATITVYGYFDNIHSRLDEIRFADGALWDFDTIKSMALVGSDDAEYIAGFDGDDVINALGGDDSVDGHGGDDTIDGGDGNDTLRGGDGNDGLFGSAGQDTLYGGAGNDILRGGPGPDDFLDGGNGNDTYVVALGDGNTTIANSGVDAANTSRHETIRFLAGIHPADLTLTSSADLNDLLITINPGAERITVSGYFSRVGPSFEFISFEFADGTVWGSDEIHQSFNGASTAADLILGGSADDELSAQSGDDLVFGNSGDDIIDGGGGDDYLYGNDGDDVLTGGFGTDRLFGGDGNDTLSDHGAINETSFLDGGQGQDTYLIGDRVGTLTIRYDESDKLKFTHYNPQDVTFSRNLNTHGSAVFGHSYADNDLILEINKRRFFSSFTNDGAIILKDFFAAAGGDERVNTIEFANGVVWDNAAIIDRLTQGTQDDDELVNTDDSGPTHTLYSAPFGPPMQYGWPSMDGFAGNDSIFGGINHEILNGGDGNDYVRGHYGNDIISGGSGDDRLYGDGFDDRLYGGPGSDDLEGGAGDDILRGDAGTGDFLKGNHGNDTYLFALGDGDTTIANDRQGYTNTGSISDGNGNRDVLRFLQGIDPADVQVSADATNLQLILQSSGEVITVYGFFSGSRYELSSVEFADGTVWNAAVLEAMALGADGGTNIIEGTAADDTINGLSLDDTIDGASGDDDIDGSTGNDILLGGAGSDRLFGNWGNDTLRGGAGDGDVLDGGAGSDTYLFGVGDGHTLINNQDSGAYSLDVLRFLQGIEPGGVGVSRSSDDLLLTVKASAEVITVSSFFALHSYALDAVEFADGTRWDRHYLESAGENRMPQIQGGIDDQIAREHEAFNFTVPANTFIDIDGDSLTYSAALVDDTPLPDWLTFDASIATFSGTPGNGEVGIVDVKVTASDATASVSGTFTLLVQNVNDAPVVLASIDDQQATQDIVFSYTVPESIFSDVDIGDVLTYSASLANGSPLPSWLNFDSVTRTFSGTPDNAQVGRIDIDVTATDGELSVSDIFSLTVNDVNDAPELLTMLPDQNATQDAPFNFTLPESAYIDVDGDALSYTATSSDEMPLPDWLHFDALTGVFSGTPGNGDVGAFDVKVTASDGMAAASDTFTLTVENINDAPVLANQISDQQTLEDVLFSYTVPESTFIDADIGDVLTYSANLSDGDALPSWLKFDALTRTLSGMPDNDQVGRFDIDITASDGISSVIDSFVLAVNNVNDAPVLEVTIPDQFATQYAAFSYSIAESIFSDADAGDALTYSASLADGAPLPSWLQFDALTRSFSGIPDVASVGELAISLAAQDNSGEFASDVFTLTISSPHNLITGTQSSEVLRGGENDDIIHALDGADYLYGGGGDDLLEGGKGRDYLLGGNGNDVLRGGEGLDDYMMGQSGNDIYQFSPGDGSARINNHDLDTNSYDVIQLLGGVTPDDVLISRYRMNMTLAIRSTGEKITVLNNYYSSHDEYSIDAVAFEDGVVWDKRKLGALALIGGEGSDRLIGYSTDDFLHGHEGDDYLFGGFGNDQLQGGLGNDVLYGESGSDLYLFESDFGMDTINNYRESFSVDSVRFEAASPQDLWFERAGNHLQISAVGADDVVTINNWYSGEAYQVDRIEAGGFTLVNSQVENLVNAMASFDAPVGVGSIIPPMHNDDLAVVLANTWQAN